MPARIFSAGNNKNILLFFVGLCLTILAGWIPLFTNLNTYIHLWRVETAASVFLLIALSYLFLSQKNNFLCCKVERQEFFFIILPVIAFMIWSGLSTFWSASWKSALFHTFIWTEYLIFYVLTRYISKDKNSLKTFLELITVTLLIIGLPAIIEYFSFTIFGGASTLGIRYAKYGEIINLVYPLFLAGAVRLNGKRFFAGLFVVTAMWLFTLSTLSRANLALFIFETLIFTAAVFLLKNFHKYRKKLVVLIFGAVLISMPLHIVALFAEKPIVPIVGRLSDSDSIAASNNFRRLTWRISLEMFEENFLIGIGADNFGMQFNDYRISYAEKNPDDANLAAAESDIAERSHNEYLQILAELGIVGGLIFLWFLCGIGLIFLKTLKSFRRLSLFSIASLLGIFAFLASSLVSSYSFRLIQNGFVFFFVLSLAARIFLKEKSSENARTEIVVAAKKLKLAYAFGTVVCFAMMTHCLTRVSSVYFMTRAEQHSSVEAAADDYQKAFWLDAENPVAHFSYGFNLLQSGKYSEAAAQIEQAAKFGYADSTSLSYLATAQSLAGQSEKAEQTFAYAVKMYPFSPFARTRYAAFLKADGKNEESEKQLDIALKLSKSQSESWWTFINKGSQAATDQAFHDKNFVAVMDLRPANAVYAVRTERELKFPEEKVQIIFGK